MYVRMPGKPGFPVFIIMEQWRFIDSILLEQGPLQEPEGRYRQALVALLAVTQGVLAALRAYLAQGLLQVEVVDMVIKVNHSCFNSNWMWRPLCKAKIITASIR